MHTSGSPEEFENVRRRPALAKIPSLPLSNCSSGDFRDSVGVFRAGEPPLATRLGIAMENLRRPAGDLTVVVVSFGDPPLLLWTLAAAVILSSTGSVLIGSGFFEYVVRRNKASHPHAGLIVEMAGHSREAGSSRKRTRISGDWGADREGLQAWSSPIRGRSGNV